MYEYLIGEYVKNLTLVDILNYARKENININNLDANTLLYYIKYHYSELISDDYQNILKEIKKKIDPTTYREVYKLYVLYRNRYLTK